MGCKGCCQEEFKRSNFGLTHEKPELFVKSQWNVHPGWYLAWRVLSSLFLLAWLIYSGSPGQDDIGPRWLIFLTNWSFFMLNFSAFIQAVLAILAHIKDKKRKEDEALFLNMPWYLKFEWVVYNIASGAALVVSLAYWALLFPSFNKPLAVLSVITHGWNSLYVIIDIFITAIPLRIYHVYHVILYAVTYAIFSVIYEFASGEDFIYPVLDWSKSPGMAALYLMMIVLVATPVLWILLYILYRIRLAIYKAFSKTTSSKKEQVV